MDEAAPAAIKSIKNYPGLTAAAKDYYLAASSLLGSWKSSKLEQKLLETKFDEKQEALDLEMKLAGAPGRKGDVVRISGTGRKTLWDLAAQAQGTDAAWQREQEKIRRHAVEDEEVRAACAGSGN